MAVRVVALRHAKPLSQGIADDSLRPLSEEGRQTQKKLMEMLKAKGIFPTKILSSPLLRAVETAEIASEFFEVSSQEEPALGDNFNSQEILKRIKEAGPNSCIFLVGHAPTLGEFLIKLVGRNVLPEGLSKSSAAIVDFESSAGFGRGKFVDYFIPK